MSFLEGLGASIRASFLKIFSGFVCSVWFSSGFCFHVFLVLCCYSYLSSSSSSSSIFFFLFLLPSSSSFLCLFLILLPSSSYSSSYFIFISFLLFPLALLRVITLHNLFFVILFVLTQRREKETEQKNLKTLFARIEEQASPFYLFLLLLPISVLCSFCCCCCSSSSSSSLLLLLLILLLLLLFLLHLTHPPREKYAKGGLHFAGA